MKIYFRISTKSVVLFLLVILSQTTIAQKDSTTTHEITIYAMPTLKPLNWESPSKLYSSMIDCYIKTITVKNNYLLGHVAVRLRSPLIAGKERLIAQTSETLNEKRNLIFKEKVGMAIMGAPLTGRIETEEELGKKLKIYAKRKKLALITYRVSESAMKRVLNFIDAYTAKNADGHASCEFYGGAFNPVFENEGSGCSAFGLALLNIVNLSHRHSEKWAIDVNIPMDLIGGKFNNNKKIKTGEIMKRREWFNPEKGIANIDYVRYFIYDPSLMFDWVMKKRRENDSTFRAYEDSGVPGVYRDARNTPFDEHKPLFEKRSEPNLFVDIFLQTRFADHRLTAPDTNKPATGEQEFDGEEIKSDTINRKHNQKHGLERETK